jgi:hypothetical protein
VVDVEKDVSYLALNLCICIYVSCLRVVGLMNVWTNILFQDCTMHCVYITLCNLQGTLNNASI